LNFDGLLSKITFDLRNGRKVVEPFGFQGVSSSEDDLLLAAEIFSADHFPSSIEDSNLNKYKNGGHISIGYVCGEFREHATSRLMAGVYECHDKTKFKVIAFDNGFNDGSNLRKRIESSVDQIISIKGKSTQAVAELIRELEVDILINLNGFYGDGRQDVFSLRPAPIQVNYLGFPGTIGVNYFDYLIADKIVIPESSRNFYREKIAYLPNCYQANDSKCAISNKSFTRQDFGLPENVFVFCCFNNNYKITPKIFDCWMRILDSVPKSVLWLIEDNGSASKNLRLEAVKRGIAVERIIFAERMPLSEHLARHRLADLFLDTLPYNAHTTASDALWAGLPVLTCLGNTFPGRVAASLLNALELSEMVMSNIEEYERYAKELAQNPSKLELVRAKLLSNIASAPLFDTALCTKNLEMLYIEMVDCHQRDTPPRFIEVI
jgi:predicted O-linked N-acetylglucosamine transferase (SPINDLY family)